MTRCRQSTNSGIGFFAIKTPEIPSELDPDRPPVLLPRPRWSRLSLLAAVLSVPAFVILLILPGLLFQRMIAMEMGSVGPLFLTLFIAIWVGFLGGIFGGLAVRRLKGPEPERRGRAWAVFATAGVRGLLMVVGGALGSVVLGRGSVDGGGDPEFIQYRWWLGLIVTLWVSGLYVRSRIRRLNQPARGRGWWVFAGGLLFHLLLITALPFSMFQAFVTFRPEVVRGGGQNRRYDGPRDAGLFAQRSLRLDQANSQDATVVVKLWEKGQPRELGRRQVLGPTTLEWKLIESVGSTNGLGLQWSSSDKAVAETWPLGLPSGKDLIPSLDPRILHVPPAMKTNLWIFQDFDQVKPLSGLSKPEWAVEVLFDSGAGK